MPDWVSKEETSSLWVVRDFSTASLIRSPCSSSSVLISRLRSTIEADRLSSFSCWLLRISSNSIALFRVLEVEFSKACDWLRRLSFNALVRLTTSSDERRVASICSFKRLTAPVASSSMMLEALINSSIWRFSSPLISSILVTEPLIWRCC